MYHYIVFPERDPPYLTKSEIIRNQYGEDTTVTMSMFKSSKYDILCDDEGLFRVRRNKHGYIVNLSFNYIAQAMGLNHMTGDGAVIGPVFLLKKNNKPFTAKEIRDIAKKLCGEFEVTQEEMIEQLKRKLPKPTKRNTTKRTKSSTSGPQKKKLKPSNQ